MVKKTDFLLILKDRPAVILLLGVIIGSLAIIIISLIRIQVSDVQVPVRYSDYGLTNLYRDKWYTLLTFTGFGFVTMVLNPFLAVKLYGHSRFIALGFMALSLLTVGIGIIITLAVFRLAALSA